MKHPHPAIIPITTLALVVLSSFSARATNASHTLTSTGTNNWSTATWTGGAPDNLTIGDIAIYGTVTTASTTTVDVAVTVGGLRTNNTGVWTIASGAGTLTLDATGLISANSPFANAGTAFLANTSTAAGGLTVNSAISIANSNLDIGTTTSGTVLLGGAITATTAQSLNFRANGSGGVTDSADIGASGSNIAISNLGTGAGAVVLNGNLGASVTSVTQNSATSSLTLSGANDFYTGTTTLTAGTLILGSNTALGDSAASLIIGGGTTIDTTSAGDILLYNSNAQTWNGNFTFRGTKNLTFGLGAITMAGNTTVTVTASTLTEYGAISGSGFGLTKAGVGGLTLQGANTYTGATTVGTAGSSTSGGTLTLGGAGSVNTSSEAFIYGSGSKLNLENTGENADRLKDTGNVTLATGGELILTGNSLANTSETIGGLVLGTNRGIITIGSQTGMVTTLAASSLTRSDFGTGLVRGSSMDQSQATFVSRITLGAAPTGADFVGTNTLDNGATNDATKALKIIPWLIGDTSTTGTGNNFVTYDTTLGLRVLKAANESNVLAADSTTQAAPVNAIGFTGSITADAGITVNSLLFNGTQALDSSGTSTPVLTVNSGAVALVTNNAASLGSGWNKLVLGNGEGVVTVVQNTLTVNTPVDITSSGGLTKAGAGTLVLSSSNLYTGATRINQGTLQIGNSTTGGLNSASVVTVNPGSTLSLNLADGGVFSNTVTNNGTIAKSAGANLNEISTNLTTGTGTLTSTFSGGILALSGNNSYTGATTITAGTLRAVANGGNTVLGVSSALSPNSSLGFSPTGSSSTDSILQLRADAATTFSTAGVVYNGSASSLRQSTIDVANAGTGSGNTLTLGGAFSIAATGTGANANILNVTGANGYKLAIGNVSFNSTTVANFNFNATTADLSIASVALGSGSFTYGFTGSGNTTITGDLVRSTASKTLTLNQSGAGSLTLQGSAATAAATNLAGYVFNLSAGTLNVNNALAMGTTSSGGMRTVNISGGTLDNASAGDITLTGNPAMFLSGDFVFGATRALNMGSGLASLGSIAGARTITTNGTSNALTLGNVTEAGASMSLTKAGTGRLVLNGPAFHTGGTTVSGGTLEVNGGAVASLSGQTGTFVAVNTTNNTHFDITVASTANMKVGQVITGTNIPAGTVIREVTSGTKLRLSQGTTGAGTFNNLAFSAGSGLGLGTVTINNVGSTLAGNGGIAGLVTIGSGSILAPGSNSTGTLGNYGGTSTTLTLSGGLTLNAGAALNFDGGDRVNVSGGLFTINGGALTLNNGVTLNAPGTYTLFNYTGATLAGSVSNLTVANPLSGVTAAFSTDGSNNVLMTLTSGGLSNNADLSSLVVTTATLAPTFSSGTTSYTATVPYATSSVTVTPTVAQVAATVKVNGVTVTSGNASAPISLNVGSNVITTDVTAEDGTTIKSYTVTVTRQTHTIEDWRQLWYGTTSNTGNAADTASPFGTGISNLFVYAFLGLNQNPATAKASQLPQFALDATNLSFTFTEPAGVSGLTYGAEYRTDLVSGSWLPVTDTGSGTNHIFSVARGANTKLFLRLKVTNP